MLPDQSSGVIVVTEPPVSGTLCASAGNKMMVVYVRLIGRWSLRPLGPRIWERWLYFTWALVMRFPALKPFISYLLLCVFTVKYASLSQMLERNCCQIKVREFPTLKGACVY